VKVCISMSTNRSYYKVIHSDVHVDTTLLLVVTSTSTCGWTGEATWPPSTHMVASQAATINFYTPVTRVVAVCVDDGNDSNSLKLQGIRDMCE